jgi:hypothetical protein
MQNVAQRTVLYTCGVHNIFNIFILYISTVLIYLKIWSVNQSACLTLCYLTDEKHTELIFFISDGMLLGLHIL